MAQISLFDGINKFAITKPIRLIELFGGYGSQAFALKYLGANFEHWKLCEWAVKSIQAYKDAHCKEDTTDYSKELTKEQIFEYLYQKGISANYNEPMSYEQVKRLGERKARIIYNNIQATHNLVNIQQAKGNDFEIKDTDKYCYVMTYSFPCQDLSSAGLGKGMEKGSGTRSGLLWEVERILDECQEKPQVLLMENVPEVIGANNVKHFAKWLEKLESLGYHCYWQVLNGKDYGIPQNRERCFMVSILGDYFYEFPKKIKLEHKLKDLLEDDVDEKFYLSDKMKEYIKAENGKWTGNDDKSIINRDIGVTINTRVGNTRADCSDYICDELPANTNLKCLGIFDYKASDKFLGNRNRFNKTEIAPTMLTNHNYGVVVNSNNNLKQKLCNELIQSGKVKEGDIIRHSYTNSRFDDFRIENKENHDCCSTLTTRADCIGVVKDYRIRKLTPKECFRLMGVKDKDFEDIAQNQSNASLYHLAGDSIIVNVLMAIFKNMIGE